MTTINLDTRELKSFRLLNKTNLLSKVFKDENTFGLFMMCDSIQPLERIELREYFKGHDIDIIYLSKQVSLGLFAKKNMKEIKNLLQGGVVYIKSKTGAPLSEDTIKMLLNLKKFSIRFLYWNNSIYTKERVEEFLNAEDLKKDKKYLVGMMSQGPFMLTLLLEQNLKFQNKI